MPKGRHKGARRQFTDFEAESARKEREEKEAHWRAQRGELPSDEEEGGEGAEKKKDVPDSSSEEESESEEESSSEEEEGEAKVPKAKGVQGLIELENPNRQGGKATRKVTDLQPDSAESLAKPQLSRREREELEKQRATAHYRKLHAAGKTEEARADLERLAIIKQKRAEAEQKRKEQLEAKEAAAAGAKKDSGTASSKGKQKS